MPEDDQSGRQPDPLLDVVADPEQGRKRLPYLLGLVDGEDPQRRLTAALAVCLVVEASPETLGYAVRRLVDRLDDDPPIAVPHALDYLAARNPRAVDEVVTEMHDEDELLAREYLYQSGAGFARSEYVTDSVGDRPVGRTRTTGGTSADDPRQVYTESAPGGEPDPLAGDSADESDAGPESDDDTPDDETHAEANGADDIDVTRGTLALVSRRLSDVIEQSRFDDLDVLTERRRERYGDLYRTVGTVDDETHAIALCIFRLPDDDPAAFAREFHSAMEQWAAVDDHDSVLTVHDWGVRPRPWAALEYTGLALADREALPVVESVANAADLADAVGHAHQRGLVHGAIDPENVRYPGATLTETERQRPRLAYAGLAGAYAGHRDLTNCLDPRYAAPEYYADRFGRIDHATDVYALGVTLYRLATGEHPYTGSLDEVRSGVLSDRSPVPSDVDPDLPAGLDQVVRKATATRKLTRYETVNHFRRELRGIDTDGA